MKLDRLEELSLQLLPQCGETGGSAPLCSKTDAWSLLSMLLGIISTDFRHPTYFIPLKLTFPNQKSVLWEQTTQWIIDFLLAQNFFMKTIGKGLRRGLICKSWRGFSKRKIVFSHYSAFTHPRKPLLQSAGQGREILRLTVWRCLLS